MATAKMTSKGQITVPKNVRERLGLRQGDEVEFVEEPQGYRVRKRLAKSPLAKYRGYLKHLDGRRSDDVVDEMRGR
jgi:antitoxin PrlF